MPANIVIFYSRRDMSWVSAFANSLKQYGLDTWYDEGPIASDFVDTLEKRIQQSDLVLVVLSPDAWNSEWVQREIDFALKIRKPMAVIQYKSVPISGFLQLRQQINVVGKSPQEAAAYVAQNVPAYQSAQVTPRELQGVHIFLSHSRKDNDFTRRLAHDLEKAGAKIWVDFEDILYGDFYKRINEGLSQSNWFVLVISPHTFESSVIDEEVNAALGMTHTKEIKAVIPIVAEDFDIRMMPPLWRQLHRYDATANYKEALLGLLRALGL
jgi:hypothetical protein